MHCSRSDICLRWDGCGTREGKGRGGNWGLGVGKDIDGFFICDLIFYVVLCTHIVHVYQPYLGWKKHKELLAWYESARKQTWLFEFGLFYGFSSPYIILFGKIRGT